MLSRLVIAALISLLCAACAPTPIRYAGYYDRARNVYTNPTAGFRLTLPPHWVTYATPQAFTVPQDLRPDQEQVLEAYDPNAQLGLVIVVQQGPVADVDTLVQRMQAVPEAPLTAYLASPTTTGFQQLGVRKTVINTHEAAEWIYTAQDTTGGQPLAVTVHTYIFAVAGNYVHIAFSVPSPQYDAVHPTIEQVVQTFQTVAS
jgi:hypothetical protein